MARILILNEDAARSDPLRRSLELNHELHFAETIDEAMKILHEHAVALVISHVHMQHTSVFEFIRIVRDDSQLHAIPFLCYCGQDDDIARYLDQTLEHAALLCGADKYVRLSKFLKSAHCDLDGLRGSIEEVLDSTLADWLTLSISFDTKYGAHPPPPEKLTSPTTEHAPTQLP